MANKGDEVTRHISQKHPILGMPNSSVTPGDRDEARRTSATIAARKAIGAETADEASEIIERDPEMGRRFDKVFCSLRSS